MLSRPKNSKKMALFILIALLVAGCSGSPQAAPTVTVTVTADPLTSSAVATEPPSDGSTTTTATADSSVDVSQPVSPGTESVGPVLGTDKAGKQLTLGDFFTPSNNWTENRYSIADKDGISGISASVNGCYESDAISLELRLANRFNRLSFSVGQSNDSPHADQTLVVRIATTDKKLDVKKVSFNSIQPFDIDVTGINAVSIEIYLDADSAKCGGDVKAVVFDPKLN